MKIKNNKNIQNSYPSATQTKSQTKEGKIALSKWLATSGLASRRESTRLIEAGEVKVNGRTIIQPYFRVEPGIDQIFVSDYRVKSPVKKQYFLINKPAGILCSTVTDSQGRTPVTQLLPLSDRLYPVGRLDVASEGLLLLTNDGDLAYRLTHPKFAIKKTYHALVSGHLDENKLARLRAGVTLKQVKTQPSEVTVISSQGRKKWLEITISQGRYHQVRRMCARVGLSVDRLIRTAEGPLQLGDLAPGEWRAISGLEISLLTQETS